MSTIDASVLYEKLFSLPATLSSDVPDLTFRERLVAAGVASEFPDTADRHLVGEALLNAFEQVEGYKVVAGQGSQIGKSLAFSSVKPAVEHELTSSSFNASDNVEDLMWSNRHFEEAAKVETPDAAFANSFEGAAHEVVGWLHYGGSGAYEGSMEAVRAMYYVFAAEHYKLPYWPSANVVAIARRFPNFLSQSSRDQIYSQLSTSLKATVADLTREFEGASTFIPPFSAIVLDRAGSPDEIADAVLAVRHEYSQFRANMFALERRRRDAKSIKDRLRVLDQIQFLCAEVSKPFASPKPILLETTLRLMPDAAELAMNPTSPSTWIRTLLSKPADLLLQWYRRRPIGKLVETSNQVASLDTYNNLIEKHFGTKAHAALQEYLLVTATTDSV